MSETRKLGALLVADVVGHSRRAGTDEDYTLDRLRCSAAVAAAWRGAERPTG
jgi:hypothetical protein